MALHCRPRQPRCLSQPHGSHAYAVIVEKLITCRTDLLIWCTAETGTQYRYMSRTTGRCNAVIHIRCLAQSIEKEIYRIFSDTLRLQLEKSYPWHRIIYKV